MTAAIAAAIAPALSLGLIFAQAQSRFRPAQYVDGPVPGVHPQTVSGGEVLVEVTVNTSGGVSEVRTLRSTPPFTGALVTAVRGWRFQPAQRLVEGLRGQPAQPPRWHRVEANVLVANIVRPPTINTPTLGELPKNVAAASEGTPYPTNIITPLFPPRARDAGTVLVEVTVGSEGRVADARILRSAAGFDASALTAARAWSFRPARVEGLAVSPYAYLIFVFRQPVLTPRR